MNYEWSLVIVTSKFPCIEFGEIRNIVESNSWSFKYSRPKCEMCLTYSTYESFNGRLLLRIQNNTVLD